MYDAFGQRQVSTIFTQLNQYHVVLEVDPKFRDDPDALKQIYVASATGQMVPLGAFSHFETVPASLASNHQGQFPAVTLSFNVANGVSLGQAVKDLKQAQSEIGMPVERAWKFPGHGKGIPGIAGQ